MLLVCSKALSNVQSDVIYQENKAVSQCCLFCMQCYENMAGFAVVCSGIN